MKTPTLCRLAVRLLLAIIASVSLAQAKHVDDVVILKNGDRLTGEIKGLQRGELKFKASYMAEAVRLDWARVERLESKSTFLVYLTDGTLFTDSVQLLPANTLRRKLAIGVDQNLSSETDGRAYENAFKPFLAPTGRSIPRLTFRA